MVAMAAKVTYKIQKSPLNLRTTTNFLQLVVDERIKSNLKSTSLQDFWKFLVPSVFNRSNSPVALARVRLSALHGEYSNTKNQSSGGQTYDNESQDCAEEGQAFTLGCSYSDS